MKKFLLYFLFMLLLFSVGMFSYGFYNGKRLQDFAAHISSIKEKHNFEDQFSQMKKDFKGNGRKNAQQIREESERFVKKLEEISNQANLAKNEIENIGFSVAAISLRESAMHYFSEVSSQAKNLGGLFQFMARVAESAQIFGEIDNVPTLEQIKPMAEQAQSQIRAIDPKVLPEPLQESGLNLKNSMDAYFSKIGEIAATPDQNASSLDALYEDFSQKEDEFFVAGKKYIDSMEDLYIIEKELDVKIEKLAKVKFSLR